MIDELGYRWERGSDPLSRYMQRTGADKAAHTDPAAALQLNLLRFMISVAESAMADEGVPSGVARRVVEKLIYGCAPQPHEAQYRQTLVQVKLDEKKEAPCPPTNPNSSTR